MANHHFGKLADVWKHLVLDEVLTALAPDRYAETHAGSAAYPMGDDPERRYGVLGFLDGAGASGLDDTAFHRLARQYVDDQPSRYPGSALQAMHLLTPGAELLLCDTDPESAEDLCGWAGRLGRAGCTVVQRDGMRTVREQLADRRRTLVHVDPFDPFAGEGGGPSAVELAGEVAEAGHALAYWYGFSSPTERLWALEDIGARTRAPLWCGDVLVTAGDGSTHTAGDLGAATTPGTGCGVLLANVPAAVTAQCTELGERLVAHYAGRPLPSGDPGRLDLVVRTAGRPTAPVNGD